MENIRLHATKVIYNLLAIIEYFNNKLYKKTIRPNEVLNPSILKMIFFYYNGKNLILIILQPQYE